MGRLFPCYKNVEMACLTAAPSTLPHPLLRYADASLGKEGGSFRASPSCAFGVDLMDIAVTTPSSVSASPFLTLPLFSHMVSTDYPLFTPPSVSARAFDLGFAVIKGTEIPRMTMAYLSPFPARLLVFRARERSSNPRFTQKKSPLG